MAAVEKKILFSTEDRNDFSVSWERSATTTKELTSYIMGLVPHDLKETVKLNQARQILMELAKVEFTVI